MSEKIVFIESNTTGTGETFAQYSNKLGYQPVLITSNLDRYSSYFRRETEVIKADTNNLNEILEICTKLHNEPPGLAGITSSSEYYIYSASVIAEKLDLAGPPSIGVDIARNKYLQRKKLKEKNIPIPDFVKVNDTTEAVKESESIGFPVIVKPVLSSGSEGVKMCRDSSEVSLHVKDLLGTKKNPRGQRNPEYILIEELVKGFEYSVETIGDKNTINVIGVTKKYLGEPPNFVEIGHDYPSPLESEAEQMLFNLAVKSLKAIGLTWGPAHTEIRITEGGPRIIEINPRLAGGMIPKLINLTQGIDLIMVILKLICGDVPRLGSHIKNRYASIRYLIPPENGVIKDIIGLNKAEQTSNIVDVAIYEKSKKFRKLHGNFNDRVGHIIAISDSINTCREDATEAIKCINFVMTSDQ